MAAGGTSQLATAAGVRSTNRALQDLGHRRYGEAVYSDKERECGAQAE